MVTLTAVACRGYKAFNNKTNLELRQITVIFGKNNSGKTTLARLPLFVASSLASEDLYALRISNLHFGVSFTDLASANQPHPAISIAAHLDKDRFIAVRLQRVITRASHEMVQPVELTLDKVIEKSIQLTETIQTPSAAFRKLLTNSELALLNKRKNMLRSIVESSIHIPGARPRIESTYPMREANGSTVDETPYLLANDAHLSDAISEWFNKSLDGTRVMNRPGFGGDSNP
jgi:predicted ATP-dependent endonuclease of OLD family